MDIAGIAVTELGGKMFTNAYERRVDPRGKVYYWMAGELVNESDKEPNLKESLEQIKIKE